MAYRRLAPIVSRAAWAGAAPVLPRSQAPTVRLVDFSSVRLSTSRPALRFFSTAPPGDETTAAAADAEDSAEEPEGPEAALKAELEAAQTQLKQQKDQLLRALADAENSRTIAKRDVSNAQDFAVTKFAKSLLNVADTLSLAMTSIPQDELEKPGNENLKTLMEGVAMTDGLLAKAFGEHGLKKYGERGDKFDPNLHDALFALEDEALESGSVAQVPQQGYVLKGRCIRPAQVGTVR